MASLRRTGLILGAVVAVVVAAGVGVYLAHAQASARDKLRDDFAQRAALAAKLTGGALASSERDSRASRDGLSETPSARFRPRSTQTKGRAQARSLSPAPDGRVLGAYPHSLRRQKPRFLATRDSARDQR